MNYDLEERTRKFAIDIVRFAKNIPNTPAYWRIISQIVGSGTSVGANYCEATEGVSARDFMHKISISNKEIKETKYWLKLMQELEEQLKPKALVLWNEAHELHCIFSKILRTCRARYGKQKLR